MELLDALLGRRSIRSYTEQPVNEEQQMKLLQAAMAAPSAGNSQPWKFVVVDDAERLAAVAAINPYAGMAKNAPLGILVCGDLETEKYPGFWVQDCSAAIQNILLAATGLRLGAVWTGIHPDEGRVTGFKQLFALPEPIIPLAFIVIGHPKTSAAPADRFDSTKIHHNIW